MKQELFLSYNIYVWRFHFCSVYFRTRRSTWQTFNPFQNKPWFLRVCSTGLLKKLREKEKLLVTSNFSFSHSVFYLFVELFAIFILCEIVVCKLFQFGKVQNSSFGKVFKDSKSKPRRGCFTIFVQSSHGVADFLLCWTHTQEPHGFAELINRNRLVIIGVE